MVWNSIRNSSGSILFGTVANVKQATIYIPKIAFIFIVEDDMRRIGWFIEKLGTRIIGIHDKPELAIENLKNLDIKEIDMFFLDHDLGGPFEPPFTEAIAEYMASQDPQIGKRTIIHSCNPAGARNLQGILPGATILPFGTFNIEDKND